MPNKIEKGKNYKAVKARQGESSRGPWEFVTVQDQRGKNEITLFVVNTPSGIAPNQRFKVTDIMSVSLGARRGSDEKWYQSYSADVVIEPIPDEFEGIENDWSADVDDEYALPY